MVYKELIPPPVVLQYYYGIDLLVSILCGEGGLPWACPPSHPEIPETRQAASPAAYFAHQPRNCCALQQLHVVTSGNLPTAEFHHPALAVGSFPPLRRLSLPLEG